MAAVTDSSWHFEGFTYDPAARRLTRDGEALPVQPRVLDALGLFLTHPGGLVTREALMAELWPGVFVTDNSLDQVIRKLRLALADIERPHRFVETVAGRGYRFLADVQTEARTTAPRRPPVPGFVGREAELRALEELLDLGPLVTVLGPGGCGKTALVRQLPHVRATTGDVHFCDLSGAVTSAEVVQAIAVGAGGASPSLDVLVRQLAPGALLILDNVERVVRQVADVIPTLLTAEVELLLTSRTRVDVAAEQCLELGPLQDADAVQLLRDRAEATRTGLSGRLTEGRAERIVSLLEGMPLAIRLAAGWLVLMHPDQLIDRLDERVAWLKTRALDLPPRQRSLRASVQWSWDLLTDAQRSVAAGCAAFRGGFTLEAAEAVLSPEHGEVAETILALRDASMLTGLAESDEDAPPRFGLPQPVREFVTAEAGVSDAVVQRHAEWVAQLGGGLLVAHRPQYRRVLYAERDNLRAAAARASDPSTRVMCTRLWFVADLHTTEPERLETGLDEAVELAEQDARPMLFGILNARALYASSRSRVDEAERDVARMLDLAEQQPMSEGVDLQVEARTTKGRIAIRRHDFEGSERVFREALDLANRSVHYASPERRARAEAALHYGIGFVRRLVGDYAGAEGSMREAITLSQQADDPWHEGLVMLSLGNTLANLRRTDEAEHAFRRAAVLHETAGDVTNASNAQVALCRLLHDRGDLDEALAIAREAAVRMRSPIYRPEALAQLGRVLGSLERYD
ncbi:MAG: winged helix-turn-helix domain-containing protein, partial [Myxococcota bacterium]